MLVWFPWEMAYKAQLVLDEPLIETLAEADALSRYDVEDVVDGAYYPDGVYWRYASSHSKRIVVEGHRVAEVMTIVVVGSERVGFTVGRATIASPVYNYVQRGEN